VTCLVVACHAVPAAGHRLCPTHEAKWAVSSDARLAAMAIEALGENAGETVRKLEESWASSASALWIGQPAPSGNVGTAGADGKGSAA